MKIWHFLLTIIITAAIVSSSLYFWQQSQFESLNKTIENLQLENESLKNETYAVDETKDKERNQLLSLNADSPECTEDAVTQSSDIGGTYTVYPVASEYKASADDSHNIAGLFTAAACGEERLDQLFGSKTFNDVVVFANDPSNDLVAYLKENNFICSDEEVPNSDCSRWYNSDAVSLEVMTGLRQWSEMIYGSDCINCG